MALMALRAEKVIMRIFTTISLMVILSGKKLRFLRYGLLRNPSVEMTVGGERRRLGLISVWVVCQGTK